MKPGCAREYVWFVDHTYSGIGLLYDLLRGCASLHPYEWLFVAVGVFGCVMTATQPRRIVTVYREQVQWQAGEGVMAYLDERIGFALWPAVAWLGFLLAHFGVVGAIAALWARAIGKAGVVRTEILPYEE